MSLRFHLDEDSPLLPRFFVLFYAAARKFPVVTLLQSKQRCPPMGGPRRRRRASKKTLYPGFAVYYQAAVINITTPPPVRSANATAFHDFPQTDSVNVAAQFEQIFVALDHVGLVAPLGQMPGAPNSA